MLGRNGNIAYVRYDHQGRIVSGGPIISAKPPRVGNWQAVSNVLGTNTTGTNGNVLRAFIRVDYFNRVVPSSLVLLTKEPGDNNSQTTWVEINAQYRGNGITTTTTTTLAPITTTTTTSSTSTSTTTSTTTIALLDFTVSKICQEQNGGIEGIILAASYVGGTPPYSTATTYFTSESAALANTSWNSDQDMYFPVGQDDGTYWVAIKDNVGTIKAKQIVIDCQPVYTSFITTYELPSAGIQVTLPYPSNSWVYTGTIDWGDGTIVPNTYANRSHTYANSGTYDVNITGCVGFYQNFNYGGTSKQYLVDIKQWGNVFQNTFSSMWAGMFSGCGLKGISATDAPLFKPNSNLDSMFAGCFSLGTNVVNISHWNMTNVTSIDTMFFNSSMFNGNVTSWDVSNVVSMNRTFSGTWSFNQNISTWDVSSVTDMTAMFSGATAFNQDLSGWCVTNIPTAPSFFDNGASAWTLPRPIWGTCPP